MACERIGWEYGRGEFRRVVVLGREASGLSKFVYTVLLEHRRLHTTEDRLCEESKAHQEQGLLDLLATSLGLVSLSVLFDGT